MLQRDFSEYNDSFGVHRDVIRYIFKICPFLKFPWDNGDVIIESADMLGGVTMTFSIKMDTTSISSFIKMIERIWEHNFRTDSTGKVTSSENDVYIIGIGRYGGNPKYKTKTIRLFSFSAGFDDAEEYEGENRSNIKLDTAKLSKQLMKMKSRLCWIQVQC